MSGTRRTPLVRLPGVQITPRAVDLFVAMGKLKCSCPPPSPMREPCTGCQQWCDLHEALHDELQLPPWQWPAVSRQSLKRAGFLDWNDDIARRMAMLKEAAKARRTVSPSREEEEPHAEAEPVAGK
jgi:hypothetical protein